MAHHLHSSEGYARRGALHECLGQPVLLDLAPLNAQSSCIMVAAKSEVTSNSFVAGSAAGFEAMAVRCGRSGWQQAARGSPGVLAISPKNAATTSALRSRRPGFDERSPVRALGLIRTRQPRSNSPRLQRSLDASWANSSIVRSLSTLACAAVMTSVCSEAMLRFRSVKAPQKFSACTGPQPFQTEAPSHHSPSLQQRRASARAEWRAIDAQLLVGIGSALSKPGELIVLTTPEGLAASFALSDARPGAIATDQRSLSAYLQRGG